MNTSELQNFFEEKNFSVNLFEQDNQQCAEIETWTSGGVDMIINLMPFTPDNFFKYVNDFDIDEEIDLNRQDKRYREVFTITNSVEDFNEFKKRLINISNELQEKLKNDHNG